MMNALDERLDRADEAWIAGQQAAALRRYCELLRGAPDSLYLWYRTAAALGALQGWAEAARGLELCAEALAEQGQLLLALGAAQDLGHADPAAAARVLRAIAERYGAGSPRLATGRSKPPPPPAPDAIAPEPEELRVAEGPALFALAHELCGDALQHWRRISAEPSPLPPHALLSALSAEDIVELGGLLQRRELAAGTVIVRQGDAGTSLFLLAHGLVAVERDGVTLAHLRPGAFFGEMALLTQEGRLASVTAERPALVFELARGALEDAVSGAPRLAEGLARAARQRLLRALLATSPLFRPLEPERREALVALFSAQVYERGEVVVHEGGAAEGLYVVLSGTVRVVRDDQGEPLLLADFGPGQVFGEISLLHQRPATATVTAVDRAVVLCLPRAAFNAHVSEFPEVVAHAYQLALEREASNAELGRSRPLLIDELDGAVIV
ncbi:MAG: cyclic nucleotide-binding domain-containing protein [Proteobacteria bacterium]|nr:cyclic nucleotide-binding domain-containing protein [Pseudomonadota bacterium]